MDATRSAILLAGLTLGALGPALGHAGSVKAQPVSLAPATMPRIASVSERYQSYNIEMLEVTGGRFWKPYGSLTDRTQPSSPPTSQPGESETPAGMDPDLYEFRPPIDLTNPKLRKLAAALGPAYVRVSGTWANTTYFPESDQTPSEPPEGFTNVLTRQQWKGVLAFAKGVEAEIVTSMAISPGVRDAAGTWTPDQAHRLLDFTEAHGGRISAAEFMNEPNLAAMGGAPKGYDAAAYGRDFKVFHAFVRQAAPDMLILGPGSVGETSGSSSALAHGSQSVLMTRDLLAASQPAHVDAFSYHHYGAASMRCTGTLGRPQNVAEAALSDDWLRRTEKSLAFYRQLRDTFEPGRPLWVTETADAACGGNPWASTFLDTFRYLDQLGRLAKQDVKVVIHNTLAASDYGLLDEKTLDPRPNYWGALLWRKLMGTTVLDADVPDLTDFHVYAHCRRGAAGGVTLLVINTDKTIARTLGVPVPGERYTLSADELQSAEVRLNGAVLRLDAHDDLPPMSGVPTAPGAVEFAPATITFLTLATAANSVCE